VWVLDGPKRFVPSSVAEHKVSMGLLGWIHTLTSSHSKRKWLLIGPSFKCRMNCVLCFGWGWSSVETLHNSQGFIKIFFKNHSNKLKNNQTINKYHIPQAIYKQIFDPLTCWIDLFKMLYHDLWIVEWILRKCWSMYNTRELGEVAERVEKHLIFMQCGVCLLEMLI
jgi:hypothetical protein